MISALVYISLTLRSNSNINNKLKEIKDQSSKIQWVQLTYGEYDAVAYVQDAKDNGELTDIIILINNVPTVTGTSTQIFAAAR